MKRRINYALLPLVLLLSSYAAVAQPALTRVTGTAYSGVSTTGQPVPATNVSITITKVLRGNTTISSKATTLKTGPAGEVDFYVLRNSVAYIEAPGIVGFEKIGGVPVPIPDAAATTFESLIPISNVPSSNLQTHAAQKAAAGTLGHVKVGARLSILADGTLSADVQTQDLSGYQPLAEKNAANGYAGLDGAGLLPDNRLPASIARDSEVGTAVAAHEGAADPHTQYLNETRGYTRALIDSMLADNSTTDRTRSNHTGTQMASTISDFASAVAANLPSNIVNTFNTRTGAVTLNSGDVTTALGFTPRDAAVATVNSFNTRSGAVTLLSADVTGVLGYTPLNPANNLSDLANTATSRTNLGLGAGNSPTFTGLTLTGLTAGSVPFVGTGGMLTQDNAGLAYNSTEKALSIGGANPLPAGYKLYVRSSTFSQALISGGTAADLFLSHTGTVADAKTLGLRSQSGRGEISSYTDAGTYLRQGIISWANLTGLVGIGLGSTTPTAGQLHVLAGSAATKGLVVQGAASQTANLQEWQNSAGTRLFSVGPEGAPRVADNGTRPTCDATRRGTVWTVFGGVGVADTFEVCLKDAADAYAWKTLTN